MSTFDSFLGKGWSFPPSFDRKLKKVEMIANEEDIKSSLEILLSTKVGERVMQPTFGCNLDDLMFDNIDIGLKTYIADLVETAIINHEPRIDLEEVTISLADQLSGVVLIEVKYQIRGTNSRFNFVYPFYKQEGSDI